MSINEGNNNWKSYQFEVEKFLEQMSDNPYITELENDLLKQKKSKLKSYLDNNKLIDLFTESEIDNIYSKLTSEALLDKFSYVYNEIIANNLDDSLYINDNDRKNEFINILDNFFNISNKNNPEHILNPTELRISTMTACCFLGTTIDTKYFYDNYNFNEKLFLNTSNDTQKKYLPEAKGIVGCKAESYPIKGRFEKDKKSTFFNSAALNVLVSDNKCINLKLFKNGKVQMTGVPYEEAGYLCVNYVIDYLKQIKDDVTTGKKVVFDVKRLKMSNYKTVLINSDYFCGMEIQRENLSTVLLDKYDLTVSYEPENYPGVKLEYFWNQSNTNVKNEGRCVCSKKCNGKGIGIGDQNCKKITVSTFQSGKVIVTGARSREQLKIAYDFINRIFAENYNFIKKRTRTNKDKIKSSINLENTKFFFLKKTNIKNYNLYGLLTK